jgi:hypothetical protein
VLVTLVVVFRVSRRNQNVAFLVGLAFAVAASANLPTILYSLFWRRFNTTGALWSIYGGLVSCVLLIVLSPAVSGRASSMIKTVDFAVYPLSTPGLVSIPLSFLFGVPAPNGPRGCRGGSRRGRSVPACPRGHPANRRCGRGNRRPLNASRPMLPLLVLVS